MYHDRYFKYAKNLAEMSDFKKYPIGCVVVYRKHIIGTGFNCEKTHPLQMEYNKLRFSTESKPHKLHAEMCALAPIRNLNIEWGEVKVYIYRICKDKTFGMARPCTSCMAYIKELGIRHLYYTTDNGFASEVLGDCPKFIA